MRNTRAIAMLYIGILSINRDETPTTYVKLATVFFSRAETKPSTNVKCVSNVEIVWEFQPFAVWILSTVKVVEVNFRIIRISEPWNMKPAVGIWNAWLIASYSPEYWANSDIVGQIKVQVLLKYLAWPLLKARFKYGRHFKRHSAKYILIL